MARRAPYCAVLAVAVASCQSERVVTSASRPVVSAPRAPAEPHGWRLVHRETFDTPIPERPWVEDTYDPASPYSTDAIYGDDGAYFRAQEGPEFTTRLHRFGAFRRAIPYGEDGWLTVEEYGRGERGARAPASWGSFTSQEGHALLVSPRTTDAAILRSTRPLPRRYRIEVTVTNIHFGGDFDPKTAPGGRVNGVRGDETAEPWSSSKASDNGVYFLCITDYPPAPHNNVFIHHHRKVVMDTDNNGLAAPVWSRVFDPRSGSAVLDGSRYVSMIFLNGETFGSDRTGNLFHSYTPGGFFEEPVFADKYRDDGTYVFAIERNDDDFTLEASGPFVHGGTTTYVARHGVRASPAIWHYNRSSEEYGPHQFDEVRRVGGREEHTWPEGSAYPDYFFFGDPHINYYEGSAEFDEVRLYVPEGP